MRYSWPFRSIADTGGRLAFGTDYPVTELNPLRGIFRAVTRLTDELQPEGGFSPDEKLTVHSSLQAYTYGSAFAADREAELGSLEPGKLADFVVIDRDYMKCPEEEIKDICSLQTVVGGEVVYETK